VTRESAVFISEQVPHALVAHDARQARHRSVRAVASSEGVVHVHVAQGGDLSGEAFVVVLFFLVKAQVFQQHQLAGSQVTDELLGRVTDAIIGQVHVLAEQLAQTQRHWLQAEGGVRFAVRSAQVRGEQHARARADRLFDRRQRGADAFVVGDLARLGERHVEIDADEHALIIQPKIVNRADAVEGAHAESSQRRRETAARAGGT
jgi:hypothetical protein